MEAGVVYALDLQPKRRDAGYTQQSLGDLLGVSRQQVAKWESGKFTIPIRHAVRCAGLFNGGLTIRFMGKEYVLCPAAQSPVSSSDDDAGGDDLPELDQVGLVGRSLHATQQAKEYVDLWNDLGKHLVAIVRGEGANEYLTRLYKEAYEARESLNRVLREGEAQHPDLVRAGIEMARREAQGLEVQVTV